MLLPPLFIDLPSAEDATRLGITLGALLRPGDTVLLDGPVGAGKTHIARAAIQSILSIPEDVPSPTFTLVQTYETSNGPLWHADLYRLTDPSEGDELGLTDAFDTAICLIEWPDRLGDMPPDALTLSLVPKGDGRTARLSWTAGTWADRLEDVVAHV